MMKIHPAVVMLALTGEHPVPRPRLIYTAEEKRCRARIGSSCQAYETCRQRRARRKRERLNRKGG